YDYVQTLRIDRPLAQRDQLNAVTYYLADHLGSIAQTTSSNGAVTLTREYDAWGNPVQGSTTGGLAFTVREWDSETGIYCFRARDSDLSGGVFLTEDPVDCRKGKSRYEYALDRPNLLVDPLGLSPCFVDCPSKVVQQYRTICDFLPSNPGPFGVSDASVA